MVKKKTCVFISGKGSNLKNLILHSRYKNFPLKICLIISNNKNAKGIIYAKKFNIPFVLVNSKIKNHENKILLNLKSHKISFICLAGYMKIISKKIIKNFQKRIINIHPSLLPKFKGINTYERVLKNKEIKTGCTVHYVNNKLDDGGIIIKKSFFLNSKENEDTLSQKTQKLEYKAYPEAIIKIFRYN
tara:strand:- start:8696 stop:9259 length:564 start_codon:yes stop_codon:yes gene_type:complete